MRTQDRQVRRERDDTTAQTDRGERRLRAGKGEQGPERSGQVFETGRDGNQ